MLRDVQSYLHELVDEGGHVIDCDIPACSKVLALALLRVGHNDALVAALIQARPSIVVILRVGVDARHLLRDNLKERATMRLIR